MTNVNANPGTFDPVAVVRDPSAIRERAHRLLELGVKGRLNHFHVDMNILPAVADFVAQVTRENYPDLNIPHHGRWRHLATGGFDRWAELRRKFSAKPVTAQDKSERTRQARVAIDLAVVSVLLGAGVGAKWMYREESTGLAVGRSEGLAIATFYMFRDGFFSSSPQNPLRVDAAALARLTGQSLASGFQAGAGNPLTGLEGRLALLRNLSLALRQRPDMFGENPARPAGLLDYLSKDGDEIRAKDILAALLEGFAPIWPGRIMLRGQNLGDVWTHSLLAYGDATDQLMPFHKLSQLLLYSLIEPLEWAGKKVTGLDELTGLAEYRSGGLFVDTGVLQLKDPHQAAVSTAHKPSDEIIVEWRALTIALLDRLRPHVAERLGLKLDAFQLVHLLEGGTWSAGRKIAAEKRPSGEPPIAILSDGTVF